VPPAEDAADRVTLRWRRQVARGSGQDTWIGDPACKRRRVVAEPKNPPLYFDMPTKDGAVQQDVVNKWTANAPLVFVHQYIGNLKQYHAIAMDVGDQDGLRVDAGKLHDIFDSYGIANSFEIYSGTHTSAVADRFQNHVMPFFSKKFMFRQELPVRI